MTFYKTPALSSSNDKIFKYIVNVFSYAAFFFLAFNRVSFYLPFFCCFFLLSILNFKNIHIKKNYVIFSLLICIYLWFVFLLGGENLLIPNPMEYFLVIQFAVLASGLGLLIQKRSEHIKLIGFYIAGLFFEGLAIAVYSVYTDPIKYGFYVVLSPFSDQELGTPALGNLASLVFVFFSYFVSQKHANYKVIPIIALNLLVGIIFAARTYFFVVALTLIAFNVTKILHRRFFFFLLSFVMVLIVVFFIIYTSPLVRHFEVIVNRFATQGVEPSGRQDLMLMALDEFFCNPFGGYSPKAATKWFHNLILDTARVAGWFPLIPLFGSFFYLLLFLWQKKFKVAFLPVWLCLISFLIMMTDVVIEGNFRVFVLFYISSIVLLFGRATFDLSQKD